jgi:hypothetical protein
MQAEPPRPSAAMHRQPEPEADATGCAPGRGPGVAAPKAAAVLAGQPEFAAARSLQLRNWPTGRPGLPTFHPATFHSSSNS